MDGYLGWQFDHLLRDGAAMWVSLCEVRWTICHHRRWASILVALTSDYAPNRFCKGELKEMEALTVYICTPGRRQHTT